MPKFLNDIVVTGEIAVGVNDTGHDVKFFGATAGAYMLWDESVDNLILGGSATLIANREFTITGDTDGEYSGDVVYFGGTDDMIIGTIYHYTSSGTWEVADADAVANCDGLLAVALGGSSDTNGMLLRGMVTLDHDPGAVGDVLFLSTTAGDATATAPSGNGDIIRVIGYCLHASDGNIWFDPDKTYVEVSA